MPGQVGQGNLLNYSFPNPLYLPDFNHSGNFAVDLDT